MFVCLRQCSQGETSDVMEQSSSACLGFGSSSICLSRQTYASFLEREARACLSSEPTLPRALLDQSVVFPGLYTWVDSHALTGHLRAVLVRACRLLVGPGKCEKMIGRACLL